MSPHDSLTILAYQADHWPAVWDLLRPVFRAGDTYAVNPAVSEADARAIWTREDKAVFVATNAGAIVGTYYLVANHAGPGSHVCNAGYVVAEAARGQGVASAMCEHSQTQARARGFGAMQYNLVASTNTGAVRLWQKHGFDILGTLPAAFKHPVEGLVDAHLMYKALPVTAPATSPATATAPAPAAATATAPAPAPMPGKVDLAKAFDQFDELWSPRIVGELNGQHVKVAKLGGEFVWHKHDDEDELFLVVVGTLHMHLRDKVVVLNEGQFLVIPRGVEHKPVAIDGAHVVLFEPAETLNTGDHGAHEFTVDRPEWLTTE